MTITEIFETLQPFGPFVGGLGFISLLVYKVWVAKIQKDKDKVVLLRLDVDGSRQLEIKGYSQAEEAKIVKQFRFAVPVLTGSNVTTTGLQNPEK